MNATCTAYQDLYMQLKQQFTVEADGKDYTLGEYMQQRALVRKESAPLAVRPARPANAAMVRFGEFLSEKLTVRTPPVKDKTMRRFPLRTSFSTALAAVTLCGLLFSFAFLGARAALPQNEAPVMEEQPEPETETAELLAEN